MYADGCTEVLKTVLKSWIDVICNRKPYVFQQNFEMADKVVVTQDWISVNLHEHNTSNVAT